MEGAAIRLAGGNQFRRLRTERVHRVMLFDPKGRYPAGVISTATTLFSADEDLVFAVTLGESWQSLDDDLPFSEFDWFSPQELRHVASILLCERDDEGILSFHPRARFTEVVDIETPVDTLGAIEPALRRLLLERSQTGDPFDFSAGAIRSCMDSGPYNLMPRSSLNIERFEGFLQQIDVRDYVTMRGLYALIKGDMLESHGFTEEAVVIVYIAMEAAFQAVLQRLTSTGMVQPTARDAAKWLFDHFDKSWGYSEPDLRFFADFYDNRVMTFHPSSRFGAVPYAPGFHGDYTHLRVALRRIFGFLISGTHAPDWEEAVAEFRNRFTSHTVAQTRRLRLASRLIIQRKTRHARMRKGS